MATLIVHRAPRASVTPSHPVASTEKPLDFCHVDASTLLIVTGPVLMFDTMTGCSERCEERVKNTRFGERQICPLGESKSVPAVDCGSALPVGRSSVMRTG